MAKKAKALPEGKRSYLTRQAIARRWCFLVICLSDDEEEDPNEVITPATKDKSNGETKKDLLPVSDWSVQRKDIVRIPDLSVKRIDLIKNQIEIRCTVICFGIVEFRVESDTVLMANTEFEFKLKSNRCERRRSVAPIRFV